MKVVATIGIIFGIILIISSSIFDKKAKKYENKADTQSILDAKLSRVDEQHRRKFIYNNAYSYFLLIIGVMIISGCLNFLTR